MEETKHFEVHRYIIKTTLLKKGHEKFMAHLLTGDCSGWLMCNNKSLTGPKLLTSEKSGITITCSVLSVVKGLTTGRNNCDCDCVINRLKVSPLISFEVLPF